MNKLLYLLASLLLILGGSCTGPSLGMDEQATSDEEKLMYALDGVCPEVMDKEVESASPASDPNPATFPVCLRGFPASISTKYKQCAKKIAKDKKITGEVLAIFRELLTKASFSEEEQVKLHIRVRKSSNKLYMIIYFESLIDKDRFWQTVDNLQVNTIAGLNAGENDVFKLEEYIEPHA